MTKNKNNRDKTFPQNRVNRVHATHVSGRRKIPRRPPHSELAESRGLKRLFRIGLDDFLPTISPLIMWLLISLIINPELVSVNAVFYPIYFIFSIVITIFGTGANISAHRYQRNETSRNDEIHSAMILGVIFTAAIFVLATANLSPFFAFLHLETDFAEYYILALAQFALFYVLNPVLQKLWFVGRNRRANFYSVFFNFLQLFITVAAAVFAKHFRVGDGFVLVCGIVPLAIFTFVVFAKNFSWPKKFVFRFAKWFRFDLIDVIQNVFFFVIYLFGFANSFDFGAEWVMLISFETLTTDAQWDAGGAINTAASVDAAEGKFVFREHRRDAIRLTMILAVSVVIMFAALFGVYKINFWLAALLVFANIFCMFPGAIYSIQANYLQVQGKSGILGLNKLFANVLRLFCSFLPTPLCTTIGMVVSVIYQYFSIKIIYFRHARRMPKKIRENLIK